MLLKHVMKLMIVVLVLLSCTHFIDAATEATQKHCCQNELCPIDCVRCDGKATCYDLSDELGCSNETDKTLMGYEKPPIFVPIILAVLKAQLRREKVELGYRFPDRNCFLPVTPASEKPHEPSYDIKDKNSPGPVTTESPVWLQLLQKLQEAFGVTMTTTTTETPVWRLLLNKLKAEQNGETYKTTLTPQSRSERHQTTTIVPQVSQTPPWRRTGLPPVTEVPEIVTKQIVEHTTGQIFSSSQAKTVPTVVPVTIKETVFFTPPKQAILTMVMPGTSTTEQTALNFSTTTSLSSSPKNEFTTEPLTSTSASEITMGTSQIKKDISENVTVANTSIPKSLKTTTDITGVTNASGAYSNEMSYSQTTAKNVNETIESSTITSKTEEINITEIPASSTMTFRTEPINLAGKQTSSTMTYRTEPINITAIPASSTMNYRTEPINITEIPTSSTMNYRTKPINITEVPASSTMASRTEQNLNLSQEISSNIDFAKTKATNYYQLRNATENTTIVDVHTGKWNKTEQSFSDAFSVTTKPPFLATADFLGVTMSTEFARTVTESETPSPLQERNLQPELINRASETNLDVMAFGKNKTTVYLNNTSEDSKRLDTNTIEFRGDSYNTQDTTSTLYNEMLKILSNGTSLNLNFTDSFSFNPFSNISDMNYMYEKSFANARNSYSPIVSDNLTSSDFTYSNLDKPSQVIVNTTLKYSMDETGITGLQLFNSKYQNSFNSSEEKGTHMLSVSVVDKQDNTLKDKLASSSIQASPENEVRIMLGKLNALVSKTLASSDFPSQPVLREFNQSQPGTTQVKETAKLTQSLVTLPTTIQPMTQYPERLQAVPPVTISPPQSATVTPIPWWGQTTLPQFSLDNLFGFTTPPLVGQSWFNPTTSSWDALFGIGGDIPVSQVTTVPPYNINNDRLNNIYDPLTSGGQMQPVSNPLPVQTTGIFNQGISSKPVIPANEYTFQNGLQNLFPSIGTPTTKVYSTYKNPQTTRSYNSENIPSTTQRSMVFNIFDTRVDSPSNFSITERRTQPVEGSNSYPTLNFKPNLNGNIEMTTPSPVERMPTEAATFSPITSPVVRLPTYTLPNKVSVTDRSVSYMPTTTTIPPMEEQKYASPILPVTTPVTRAVYNMSPKRPITTATPRQTTMPTSPPFTRVVSNLWGQPTQTTKPVTEYNPVTRPVVQTNPTSRFPSWNSGSNRILSTDIISSWWAQVQPSTPAPAYVAPPTPTPVPGGEQCYEVQDVSGFCQTRYSGHYRNPADCRSFYVCIWGFLHSCTCPQDTMFDDKINVCNWDYLVTCATQP